MIKIATTFTFGILELFTVRHLKFAIFAHVDNITTLFSAYMVYSYYGKLSVCFGQILLEMQNTEGKTQNCGKEFLRRNAKIQINNFEIFAF